MQIVYVILLAIGYISYTVKVYPYFSESILGKMPYLLLGINVYVYYQCAYRDPGVITNENNRLYLKMYPFDDCLYHERRYCETCKFEKPARSKHCSKWKRMFCVIHFKG